MTTVVRHMPPRTVRALKEITQMIERRYPGVDFQVRFGERSERVFLCPIVEAGEILNILELVKGRLQQMREQGINITVNLSGDPDVEPLQEDQA
ncbi:hypothetical protein ACFWAP_16350 [Streptomyces goshikiensis]|uniref:hypothetical protein n=1 Tax=Streptomyces goshikiensis TaxID=1942 RepID=UPI003652B32B